MYCIHNTMRGYQTKALRTAANVRGKNLKFVLKDKRTIARGRPAILNEKEFQENLEELCDLFNSGCIRISVGNTWVDPNTMNTKERAVPAKTKPNFPPDTTARDITGPLNPPPKVEPLPKEFKMPNEEIGRASCRERV